MSILALDVSLTSTGIAYELPQPDGPYVDPDEPKFYVSHIETNKLRGMERIGNVAAIIRGTVYHHMPGGCDMIVMEGPAFGFKQQATRSHSLGELHGAIKFFAYDARLAILTVPPSTLKKFVTGSGGPNVKKEHVIAGVTEMWGMELPQDDEADAFGLLQFGIAYRHPRKRRRYDAARRAALNGAHLERH